MPVTKLAAENTSLLYKPVAVIPGVTPRVAAQLDRLGIETVLDLIRHFPYRYDDLRRPSKIAELSRERAPADNGPVPEMNVLGAIVRFNHVRLRGRIRSKTSAVIDDGSGTMQAIWFGRPYLGSQLKAGDRVFVRGRVEHTLAGVAMNVSKHRVLKDGEKYSGELVPVYPQTAGLTSYDLRKIIRTATKLALTDERARNELDPLPASINSRERFGDARLAIKQIHAPETLEQAEAARRRLVYEEFFLLALAAARRRAERAAEPAPDFSTVATPKALQDFAAELPGLFPFALTGAQRRAIEEVVTDMRKRSPMNRLLHGDVGSGKTAVAVAAMLLAARAGYQSAFMAPTEVLAAQQFNKTYSLLSGLGLRSALVIGALKRRTREDILEQLRSGDLHIVIGTHALITEDVTFANLGLVIIDEQHRFGVMQRAALRAKAHEVQPHTLVMTATPIPRTLAQTVYADLDISVLDELPPGRKPVKTYVRAHDQLPKVLDFVRAQVEAGRQAFVVCPAIDESERALHSAVAQAEELRKTAFKGIVVALLHGRMSVAQKDQILRMFVDGFIKILISTTVIEVGVDIPNANVMLVLDAHAFGLAQLHQLRGRVGRGKDQAYCILIAPDNHEDAARLGILAKTNDGFVIAEEDMKLRGSGDLAGTRQHGGYELRLAHLIHDFPVFVKAKKAAEALVQSDPTLEKAEHRKLAAYLGAQNRAATLRITS